MLPKSLHSSPEERNDANNKDDTPNVHHFASHPECDDCNKESYKNKSLDRSNKPTKQNLANNTSYSEGILKCLLFLIYYLKQFVHCQEHQTSDGKIIYQYMAYFGIASVYFDMQVIQELHSMILLWKELCSDVLQYWPEGVECLEEQLSVDEIQRWKELEHAMLLQCCRGQCGSSSFPAMLQYWDLDHFFSFPVDLNLQNNPSDFVTLQMAKFGDRFFDDIVLVCNIGSTSLTVPNFFVPIFGSFPYHYKLLQQVKNFDGTGKQASDRSNNNSKQSQSETSKWSGSAGSSTSSSTTGGGHYRAGSTGSCGSSGRGDDEEDGGRKQGRIPRYTYNAPCAIQWEEEEEEGDSKDHNEAASTATAPWPLSRDDSCSEPGKSKTMKTPHKTAKPIVYDLVIRCSNGMDMLAVTSPMMNLPLSGDDPHDELPATTPAVSNEIFTVRCCYEVHKYLIVGKFGEEKFVE